MSKLITNIERRMRMTGNTQKSLALRAGLNETAVRDILKGRSKDPQFSTLNGISRVLGCAVEELFLEPPKPVKYGLGEGPPPVSPWPTEAAESATEVLKSSGTEDLYVEELDITAAKSPLVLTDGRRKRPLHVWQLPQDSLEGVDTTLADLKIVRVQGDSMVPDFMPGDRVIVNLQDQLPSPSGVFLLWDGTGFILRRCEISPNSKPPRLMMRARNADYGTHEVNLKDIHISGRVLGRWQKV